MSLRTATSKERTPKSEAFREGNLLTQIKAVPDTQRNAQESVARLFRMFLPLGKSWTWHGSQQAFALVPIWVGNSGLGEGPNWFAQAVLVPFFPG